MKTSRDDLSRRIAETISALSDEELLKVLEIDSANYTPYALQVACDEMARRRQRRPPQPVSAVDNYGQEQANGCYIEIWRDKDCGGEHLRIEGPIEYRTLKAHVTDWGNDISSLCVGPNAFVEVFENEAFEGKMLCFGPNEEVPDLGKYKFNDDTESIKIINSLRLFERARQDQQADEANVSLTLEQELAVGNRVRNKKARGTRTRKKR